MSCSLSKGVERAVVKICDYYNLKEEEVKWLVCGKTKKIEKPSTVIPFIKKVYGWCDGLKVNHGVYSQCTNKPSVKGELCKSCEKQAEKNEHGKPNNGLASEREEMMEMWRDPKNRAPSQFGNVAKKLELDMDLVVSEMKRVYGLDEDYEMPSELMETKKSGRGRPKKVNPVVNDSDDEEERKQRGRPKKSKKVIPETKDGEDLITALVAQAESEKELSENEKEEDESAKVTEKPKNTKKGKLSDEEKEAAKEAKKAEKKRKLWKL